MSSRGGAAGRRAPRHRQFVVADPPAPPGPTGPCGSAYTEEQSQVLDGASGYIEHGDANALNGLGGVSAWMKFTGSLPGVQVIIAGKGVPAVAASSEWELCWHPALHFFFRRTTTLNIQNSVVIAGTFGGGGTVLNTWYHVFAGIFGASLRIYVDAAHGATNALEGTIATNRKKFRIGVDGDGGNGWTGEVAQVVRYDAFANEAALVAAKDANWNGGAGVRYGDGSGVSQVAAANWWELWENEDEATYCDYKGSEDLTRVGAGVLLGGAPL